MAKLGLAFWLTQWDGEPSLSMRALEVAVSFPLCVGEGPFPSRGDENIRREACQSRHEMGQIFDKYVGDLFVL
jgi:hypothetical protein